MPPTIRVGPDRLAKDAKRAVRCVTRSGMECEADALLEISGMTVRTIKGHSANHCVGRKRNIPEG